MTYMQPILGTVNVSGLTDVNWCIYMCISKLTIIGSDNGLSPGGHQTII